MFDFDNKRRAGRAHFNADSTSNPSSRIDVIQEMDSSASLSTSWMGTREFALWAAGWSGSRFNVIRKKFASDEVPSYEEIRPMSVMIQTLIARWLNMKDFADPGWQHIPSNRWIDINWFQHLVAVSRRLAWLMSDRTPRPLTHDGRASKVSVPAWMERRCPRSA